MEPTELSDRQVAHRVAGGLVVILPLLIVMQVVLFFIVNQDGAGPLSVATFAVTVGALALGTVAAAVTFYVIGRRSR